MIYAVCLIWAYESSGMMLENVDKYSFEVYTCSYPHKDTVDYEPNILGSTILYKTVSFLHIFKEMSLVFLIIFK